MGEVPGPNGERRLPSSGRGGKRPSLHPLGIWERLFNLVQERGVQLGMEFLDGTNISAHQKAAGAARKGDLKKSEMLVKRLAGVVVAEPAPV